MPIGAWIICALISIGIVAMAVPIAMDTKKVTSVIIAVIAIGTIAALFGFSLWYF